MTGLTLEVRTEGLQRALKRAPDVMTKHLRPVMGRQALTIARSARRLAPKGFSTLTHAIAGSSSIDGLEGRVSAGVNYARMVEEGTGAGGNPPLNTLLEWIRVKRLVPDDPDMDERDLAFVIQEKINLHGTPAQPFMAPALALHAAAAERAIVGAINKALREIN